MKKKILIGFLNKDITGAIPTITQAFIDGLGDEYDLVPFYMDRNHENIQTKFNLINFKYFIIHFKNWIIAINKHKPDIVHYPITSYWNLEKSLLFLATARILGVKKTVGHLHGGAFKIFWNSLNHFRKAIAYKIMNKLNAFIVLSSYWHEVAINNIGLSKKKVYEVNNPINNEYERYFESFNRIYEIEGKFNIVSISGLTQRKGIMDSISALKTLSGDYLYSVVGNEVEKGFVEKVKKVIEEDCLNKNIELVGPMFGMDKVELMSDSDLYLLPSHVENLPLAIIEAACAGLPIITTPVGALPEFFTHMKNIYFVEPGNIEQIQEAIDYLINSFEERKRLGVAARQVFKQHLSRKKIMNQLKQVYENC